jgi:hypothetical protein
MTRKERLIKKIAQSMDDVPDAFFRGVKAAQREAFALMVSELADLALDEAGNVIISQGNFAKVQTLTNKMKAAYNNPKYTEALRGFVDSMTEGAELSAKLMGVITGQAYTQSAKVQAILGNAKSTTLDLLSTNAPADAAAAFRKVIENSVATGENFGQVLRNVRKNIEGSADFQGRMERYAKQNAYDFYSISQAQVINEMTEELGFEFYEYIGVDVKGTRSFCSQRNNQIYHSKEVEGWASLDWDGKNRTTNSSTIWALRGGYNCGHQLIPVATEDVPQNVKDRAEAAGFYAPKEE